MAGPSIGPETCAFRVRRTIDCATRLPVALSMMLIGPANALAVDAVGLFGHFFLSFIISLFFSLSLGDGPI